MSAPIPPSPHSNELSSSESEWLSDFAERGKWKFAWSLARTYPHEYTTKALSPPADHAKLIDLIERYGVVEHFRDTQRKYLYFQERKYWHMGFPDSEKAEDWPNVINRTWIDVRRHAANVRHVWTAEEVWQFPPPDTKRCTRSVPLTRRTAPNLTIGLGFFGGVGYGRERILLGS